jgi:hypothetical protein
MMAHPPPLSGAGRYTRDLNASNRHEQNMHIMFPRGGEILIGNSANQGFGFAFNPNSTRRRMASAMVGRSSCDF